MFDILEEIKNIIITENIKDVKINMDFTDGRMAKIKKTIGGKNKA